MTEDDLKRFWGKVYKTKTCWYSPWRGFELETTTKCQGSQCMAWRTKASWSFEDWMTYKKMTNEDKAKFSPPKENEGHCGLAGKP